MPNTEPTEFAIVRLGEGEKAQYAIGALPRAGRLPFKQVLAHPTHLTVTGHDGVAEDLGSAEEPLDAGVLEQLHSSDGLVFAELDEETGMNAMTDELLKQSAIQPQAVVEVRGKSSALLKAAGCFAAGIAA
ncbi:hypothetical protein KXX11_004511, partial [Aspergillus fumigatus]